MEMFKDTMKQIANHEARSSGEDGSIDDPNESTSSASNVVAVVEVRTDDMRRISE